MSLRPIQLEQLPYGGITSLVQVVFDNIEEGRYYYVHEREPGETHYDLYGRVTDKNPDSVTIAVLYRRPIVGLNEGGWEVTDNEHDAMIYRATRDLVNSFEQDMSARYYLPEEGVGSDIDSDTDSD
jgi:hypothetical protein